MKQYFGVDITMEREEEENRQAQIQTVAGMIFQYIC